MKRILFFISIIIMLAFTNGDATLKSTSVVITPESSLLVRGTTNINTFTCEFNINKFKNPIKVIYHIEDDKMIFDKTALILDSDCFDCGGKAINNDFKKILKTNKYPQILLYLNEISLFDDESDVKASIDIEIAGIKETYKIPVKIKKNNEILITGGLAISLTDYNLVAPKKLLGLISVNDKIQIYFQLLVKEFQD
ncbi:hypothetical protein [uncultured Wocania sp.]|uniref:YceI family protein n=1 Tax=uncultured Wocania sp. TaxID=2834404 RepID=UPI0030F89BB1